MELKYLTVVMLIAVQVPQLVVSHIESKPGLEYDISKLNDADINRCLVNKDCARGLRCIAGICKNPCDGACGKHTDCIVSGSSPVCSCKSKYAGDPEKGCKPVVPVKARITLTETKFLAGTDISIPCELEGYPAPAVSWYKNNQLLENTDNIKITGDSTLTISRADVYDSATYKCEATNRYSMNSSSEISIFVMVPVKTDITMEETLFQAGSEIVIHCDVEGYPTPTVTWYKDTELLYNSDNVHIYDNLLIVVKADIKYEGMYKCEAANEYNTSNSEVYIRVQVPVKTNISMEETVFQVGSEIVIPCEVEGHPTPQVTWYKDNQLLNSSDNINIYIFEFNKLKVVNASTSDSGTYKCVAANEYSSHYSEVDIYIEVPVKTKINIKKTLFQVGSEIVIPCDVEGYPAPTVTWYRNNYTLQNRENIQITERGLTVLEAHVTDKGTYKCSADNGYSSSYSEVDIEVEVPVNTKITMEMTVFLVNSTISIRCDVEGYPYPEVMWFKDKIALQKSEKTQTSDTLTIINAATTDSGTYICEAANMYSSSSSEVTITVEACAVHEDCEQDEMCRLGSCYDPCSTANYCGANTTCEVANHEIYCSCLKGYVGNPRSGCTLPKFSQCKTLTTYGNGYEQFIPVSADKDFLLRFMVATDSNAYIMLTPSPSFQTIYFNPMYEIVLGERNNSYSGIRRTRLGFFKVDVDSKDIISATEFRGFWIRMTPQGYILVGKTGEELPFMEWQDPEPLNIKYFSFGSYANYGSEPARWYFDCADGDYSGGRV